MNILERIVAAKRAGVESRKKEVSLQTLRAAASYSRPVLSLKEKLLANEGTGIIAEFKRRSPSRGLINGDVQVLDVVGAYARHGASAVSVLTDEEFFGGSAGDLETARAIDIPILRKDFIIDAYQLEESRAMGADLILLIAACLSPGEVASLARAARDLGLEVLLEIHNKEELGHICDQVDLVGVNNRDLKTFSVSLERSIELSELIPAGKPMIAESGIQDPAAIQTLRQYGFRGFLVGERFMKEADPAIAFASFVHELKQLSHEGESMRHDATGPGEKAR